MNKKTNKQTIYDKYSTLLRLLNEAHNSMVSLSPANKDVKQYVDVFRNILMKSIEETRKRIEEIQTCMVWDHLVIAFFGSTNAGKSTIIETLRLKYEVNKSDSDGEIVGTGEPDFTKKDPEYDLSICGNKITVIDMPGILNNEDNFKKQIQSALNKAHLIFYVDRDGTTPDAETVKKIRAYLQDWVKVYTIYNVAGFIVSTDYLQNSNVKESVRLIEKGYTDALENCYAGNITLHAFFALASLANFPSTRDDLIRKQASCMKIFDSCDKMFDYSEFSSLIDVISTQIDNYKDEIFAANKQRLIAITNLTRNCLSDELKNNLNKQREVPIKLKKIRNDICRYYDTAVSNIKSSCFSIIKNHLSDLNYECKKLIDQEEKELDKKCADLQKHTIQLICEDQKQKVSDIIRQLSSNIERKKKELETLMPQLNIHVFYIPGQARIDFQGAEKCVKFNFENVMDILGDIAVGIGIGSPAGPWGMLVGGLGGLGKGLYDSFWGDSYKKKAKAAIEKAMNQLEEELQKSTNLSVELTVKRVREQRDKNMIAINFEIDKISQAVKIVEASCNKLKVFEKD